MRDDADELELLAAVDPAVRHQPVEAASAAASDLFERITMTNTNTSTSDGAASRARRPLLIAAAAAAFVVLAAVGGLVLAGDDADSTDVAADPSSADTSAGAISPGGSSTGSCVEVYDTDTLAKRETAFAGTVASIDGDSATFEVDRWFRGGDGPTVTLRGAEVLGGMTSAGEAVLTPGAEVLVAGDGGFAWACGFTQPHAPAVAEQWAEVFSE